MFCTNCGKQNSDEAKFCYSCGGNLDKSNHNKQDIKKQNEINFNNNSEPSINKKTLENNDTCSIPLDTDYEKEFIFKSFKAGGAARFSSLTQIICNKDLIKVTRNYRPILKKEPDELINTQEVKSVNYKLNLSIISIILIIFVFIAALIYIGFLYAIMALILMIVLDLQTKISIVTTDKKYIVFCGTFGGRAQAKELANFITNKLNKN
ncbi:zinc ribbon domain-containing protein [Clostridium guangxiense]|uniref:zinc ribbon domain-containing protein n=1 Tax=Clostridium guangxiense TaxID=1662055 RepID=UPI001E493A6F|nr:zinc ribbon domain-containing protein [Clostridium guangxiense]MCD2346859.1 zinc ribbon domain-containing protein [Clostridium guangxiense]